MDRKIDAGALLVAASAALLVVSLFLDWYGLSLTSRFTAWEAFEVLDLVLLAAAVAAVAAAFGRLDSRVLLGAALVAVVVVISQLIDPPPAGQGGEIETGAWLALAAAGGLLAGAALVAAEIGVTVDVRGRERRRRVATVDKRGAAAPAPPAESFGARGPARAEPFAPGAPAPGAAPSRPAGAGPSSAPGGEEQTSVVDRFAPEPPAGGDRATDPEATQPFAGPPDDPAAR